MLELIPRGLNIDFVGKAKFCITLSLLIILFGVGSIIELSATIDEPVELIVNGKSLARGEVVTIDGFYGVRITEISNVSERIRSINS